MKILIAPTEISGYYSSLAIGFRSLNVNSDFFLKFPHPFDYGGESSLTFLLRINRYLFEKVKIFSTKDIDFFKKVIFFFLRIIFQINWILWSLKSIIKYDVFIFGFCRSLLPKNIDLILIRLLNKKIIFNIGHGSEARPPYMNGAFQHLDTSNKKDGKLMIKIIKNQLRSIKKIEALSNYVIGTPYSTSPFARKVFINRYCLGYQIFTQNKFTTNSSLTSSNSQRNVFKILHAPSSPLNKGSEIISTSINSLKLEGYNVELETVQGKNNSEILAEIEKCDLVIDQVYGDLLMGGVVRDAFSKGKPCLVGGYQLNELRELIPQDLVPPTLTCKPYELKQTILDLVEGKLDLKEVGKAGYEYVHIKCIDVEIAKRYLQIINNQIPTSWWYDPGMSTYLFGNGQAEDITKNQIIGLIENYGLSSLGLNRNKKFLQILLNFVYK
jgi:hypothetical protein